MKSKSGYFSDLRSKEVKDLLENPPNSIIRWGTIYIFLFILLLLCSMCMINYPKVIKSSFKFTSINAYRTVKSQYEGKVLHLLVKEGDFVKTGIPVAYFVNIDSYNDIIKFSRELTTMYTFIRKGEVYKLSQLNLNNYRHLTELQTKYGELIRAIIEFQTCIKLYNQKKILIDQKFNNLILFANAVYTQQKVRIKNPVLIYPIFLQKYNSEKKKFYLSGLVNNINYDLNAPYFKLTNHSLIDESVIRKNTQLEMLKLNKEFLEARNKFLRVLNTLKNEVISWKKILVIKSPDNGRIHFLGKLTSNQIISENQKLFCVLPIKKIYFGELLVPQQNVYNIKVGQQVLIKFIDYPFQEYSALKGHITYMDRIIHKSKQALIKVKIEEDLKNTYGKKLNFDSHSIALAEIVTVNTRLYDRILFWLKNCIVKK